MRILPLLFLLAGCSTMGAGVTGNEMSVTVSNVWNRSQAFAMADEHCHKYAKVARASTDDGDYSFSFDCVRPD